VRFDLHFVEARQLEVESVTERMLAIDQVYWRLADDATPAVTRLVDLSQEMRSHGRNRLPLLDGGKRIKHVVHKGTIDDFILANLPRANELTLADLLVHPTTKAIVTETFVVVSRLATVSHARSVAGGNVRDIFVTATGSPDEPVEGWLTNVDLARPPVGKVGADVGDAA
jgi:hypothetical protein